MDIEGSPAIGIGSLCLIDGAHLLDSCSGSPRPTREGVYTKTPIRWSILRTLRRGIEIDIQIFLLS
jgi:hypothetical protein